MKVAFVTRMFSGLIDSVAKSEWKPYGVPAIYKLVEGLNKMGASLDVFLLCKTEEESKNTRGLIRLKFKGLNANFYVLQYYHLKIKSTKLRQLYNDCIQFNTVFMKFILGGKYDLIYFDRVNIVLAAICSLLGKKIVVRFLGVADLLQYEEKFTQIILYPLAYLSRRAPFSLVICSEDGTPSRNLFSKCLHKKTPVRILLNGTDKNMSQGDQGFSIRLKYNFNDNYPVLLFVARMTMDKGADEFVDALIGLKRRSKKFYAVIVCGGSDFDLLKEKIQFNGLKNYVVFERFVKHVKIFSYFDQSDVYISLNKLGNLSNTVLEAMSAGKCIIMLGKDKKTHADESTERLVPSGITIRIDRDNIVNDLIKKLADLIGDLEKIRILSKRMKNFSGKFLWSWDERINYEIELLRKVAKGIKIPYEL